MVFLQTTASNRLPKIEADFSGQTPLRGELSIATTRECASVLERRLIDRTSDSGVCDYRVKVATYAAVVVEAQARQDSPWSASCL